MSAPVRMTSPDDGATLPPMTLSRVDLPAPFGPHSPNRPRSGQREGDVVQHAEAAVLLEDAPDLEQRSGPARRRPASAGRIPALRRRRAAATAGGLGRPARVGQPCDRPARRGPAAPALSGAPVASGRPPRSAGSAPGRVAQPGDPGLHDAGQPLRVHQQHHGEQHALDDEDVDAHPVARALQVLDDKRADDRADDRAPPADEQHDQQGQLGGRVDHGLRHELLGARVDRAAEGGEHAAEHEQLELAPRRADPERGRGPLVDAEHEQLEADVGGEDPWRR